MKVYKGTDKNLQCHGYQFTSGKTEEIDGEINLCERGFHACEVPLDVWRYYPPINGNRYFEATLDGVSGETSDDSKRVGKKITLGAEIGIPGLVKAHVEYVRENAQREKKGGNKSNLAGGDKSNLVGGDWSNLAGGNGSNLAGGNGSNLAGGNRSNLAGGIRSNLVGGNESNLAGGDWSNLAGGNESNLAGGDWSNLAGGDWSDLVGGNGSNLAGGDESCIIARNGSKAKAGIGSVICFCDVIDGLVACEHIVIDGERYKPDVWYEYRDGKITESEG